MYISKTDTLTAFYNHSKVYFLPQTGDVLQYINVSVVIEQTHVSPTGTRRRFLMSDNCFTDRQQTSSMTPHARWIVYCLIRMERQLMRLTWMKKLWLSNNFIFLLTYNCELCHYLPKSKSELRHSPFELSNICSFVLDTNIIFTKRKVYVDKNSGTNCRKGQLAMRYNTPCVALFFNYKCWQFKKVEEVRKKA